MAAKREKEALVLEIRAIKGKIAELDDQSGKAAKQQRKEYTKQLSKLESRMSSVGEDSKMLARFEAEKKSIQAQRDLVTKKCASSPLIMWFDWWRVISPCLHGG